VELGENGNLLDWTVYIAGPHGTPYEGGIFKGQMTFPPDYPNSPPQLKFLSEFWHPNVYSDGRVCISILHTPDPMNPEEKAEECWRPIQTVESILVSVCSMLADPNFSSPANVDASVELRKTPDVYKKHVQRIVDKSQKELPSGFEMPKAKLQKHEPEIDNVFDPMDDFNDYDDVDGADDDDLEFEDEAEEAED